MNVLIISSSPRAHGNSDLLCEAFAGGARSAGHEVELFDLRRHPIKPCLACYACMKNGGTCCQKDDMNTLMEKLLAADAICLASPVYFYSICAQLKAVIDRCVARYKDLCGKKFYFILTAADGREEILRAAEPLRGYVDCLPGSVECGALFAHGVWEKGDVTNTSFTDEARAMGAAIA